VTWEIACSSDVLITKTSIVSKIMNSDALRVTVSYLREVISKCSNTLELFKYQAVIEPKHLYSTM